MTDLHEIYREVMIMDLQSLIAEAYQTAVKKGWWDDYHKIMKQIELVKSYHSKDSHIKEILEFWDSMRLNWIAAKLALIHSEVSEMEEAATEKDYAEELSDVCIRIFDLLGGLKGNMKGLTQFGPGFIQDNFSINWYISQALERLREDDIYGLCQLLLNTYSKCLRVAAKQGIVLEEAIAEKMEKNKLRPYKHGKRL